MRPDDAINRLQALKAEAESIGSSDEVTSWTNRLRALLSRVLGRDDDLIKKLEHVWFSPGVFYDDQPASEFTEARASGIREACALIDVAIYQVHLSLDEDDSLAGANFDPELWEHVRGLIEARDWGKIPANVAVFVEDKTRTWAQLGNDLVGKGLYGKALADAGSLRLGSQANEWEGWRALGVGLAGAIGNVDRHRIQTRTDLRRYALGVLGLGSLILTQMRYQHPELT